MSPHLPEELLDLIVQHLRLPSARRIGEKRESDFNRLSEHDKTVQQNLVTLARLSRTSRPLLRIARPILYEVYPGFRIVNARDFVRSLINKPECADCVRGLVIDKWESIAHGDSPVDLSPSPLESQCLQYVSSLRRRTSCYPTGMGSGIGAELESGRADVVLSMLIVLCHNVEELEVSVPCIPERSQAAAFLRGHSLVFLLDALQAHRWTADSHKRYQKIRHFSIRLARPSGVFGAAFAKRILRMANTETFSAYHLHCQRLLTSTDYRIAEQPWPGLRKIELREVRLDNVMVGVLLLRAPNLEVLDLQWAIQDYPLDFPKIAASLNTWGHNLKSVTLDTRQNFTHVQDENGESLVAEGRGEPLGNLRELKQLQYLAITPRALLGRPTAREHSDELTGLFGETLESLTFLGPTRESSSSSLTELMYQKVHGLLQSGINPLMRLRSIDLQGVASDLTDHDFGDWKSTATQPEWMKPFSWDISLKRP